MINIPNINDLQDQLEIIFTCSPGLHEIRVIGRYYTVSLDGKRLERILIKDSGDPQAYAINLARTAKEALALIQQHFTDYQAHNCYLAINRVSDNFKLKVKSYQIGDYEYPIALMCTKAKDIQGICALIIDLDRENTPTDSQGVKLAASSQELKTLDEGRQEIVRELEEYKLKPNYQICSGNGYQIAYFFPTQIDINPTRKILETILNGLHEKYKGKVCVDTAMADPVRVARLCGMWNKKPDRAINEEQGRIYRIASFLEGQCQLNQYENIRKTAKAMQPWQQKGKQKKKAIMAKGQTVSLKENIDQDWINNNLRNISLLEILQRFYTVNVTGNSGDKTQLCCPYHEDHNPSAWIATNTNGIEMLHCSSPHCHVYNQPKTALQVVMDNGYTFIWALLELFGDLPQEYIKTCYRCGEEVFLDGKKRYNRNNKTLHECNKRTKKAISEVTPLSSDKPVIEVIGGQLPGMVDAAEQTLITNAREVQIYQRAGMLVRPIVAKVAKAKKIRGIKRSEGALIIQAIEIPFIVEQFTKFANWMKYDTRLDDYKNIDCPKAVAETYLARGVWNVPILTGIIEAPTLRSDGSILDKPGYDEETGLLFYQNTTSFTPIPQTPTKEDALKALELYRNILKDFPFVEELDFSVQLSAQLTSLIRYSIRTAPIHGISAPKARSGKSLLADIVAMVTTGRPAAVVSQADSSEEEKKRLLSVLMAGDSVVGIDNIEKPLASDSLCSILTQEYWQERLLGVAACNHPETKLQS